MTDDISKQIEQEQKTLREAIEKNDALYKEMSERTAQMNDEQIAQERASMERALQQEQYFKEQLRKDELNKERSYSEDEQATYYSNISRSDSDKKETSAPVSSVPLAGEEKNVAEGKYSGGSSNGSSLAQAWENGRMQALQRDERHQNNQENLRNKAIELTQKGDDFGAKMVVLERERENSAYKSDIWNDIANKENIMRGDSKEYKEYVRDRDLARNDSIIINDAMKRERELAQNPDGHNLGKDETGIQQALQAREAQQAIVRSQDHFKDQQGNIPADKREMVRNVYEGGLNGKPKDKADEAQQSKDLWDKVARDEKAMFGETNTYKQAVENSQHCQKIVDNLKKEDVSSDKQSEVIKDQKKEQVQEKKEEPEKKTFKMSQMTEAQRKSLSASVKQNEQNGLYEKDSAKTEANSIGMVGLIRKQARDDNDVDNMEDDRDTSHEQDRDMNYHENKVNEHKYESDADHKKEEEAHGMRR